MPLPKVHAIESLTRTVVDGSKLKCQPCVHNVFRNDEMANVIIGDLNMECSWHNLRIRSDASVYKCTGIIIYEEQFRSVVDGLFQVFEAFIVVASHSKALLGFPDTMSLHLLPEVVS